MKKMVANVPFTYAEKRLQPGDKFDCEDRFAPALAHLHRASYADNDDAADEPVARPAPKKGKLRYQRRDMRARE